MGAQAAQGFDEAGTFPRSALLVRLVLVPSPPTPRERLEEALGPELTRLLLNALGENHGHGRRGSSSP